MSAGAIVIIFDDFFNGCDANLSGSASVGRVVRGSICDSEALASAMKGAEVVFHLAAMGSVPRSLEVPDRYQEVNVTGSLRVL